jgi:acyl-coenzyme A synthetase/AMP-(fatty) acid ligase
MDLARNLIGRINVGDSLTRSAATRSGQLAVVFVDQLPKTSTGKIQKNVIRSAHASHYQEG